MTYREMLQEEFSLRRSKTSMTKEEFAKLLGVSPSFLGRIMSGKRNLGEKKSFEIAKTLWGTESKKVDIFCQQATITRSKSPEYKHYYMEQTKKYLPSRALLKPDIFKSIYHWHNLAILCLFHLKDFRFDIQWISKKLNISPIKVEVALERLKQANIINENEEKYSSINLNHEIKGTPSKFIRIFHEEMLKKAQLAIHEQDHDQRSITGTLMAVNSKKINEANEKINEFRKELAEFLSTGEKDAIYHLNINLFQVDQK